MTNFLARLNELVWGWPMAALLLGTGILLSLRTGFVQIRCFFQSFRLTFGGIRRKSRGDGTVSPFQALTTALAATVGTGNIAGVAGAIALGGPGSVFWMWVSAILGMATKYAEIALAVRWRRRNGRGELVGGPMEYISRGIRKGSRPLAVSFAILGMLTAIGSGNMLQTNSAAQMVSRGMGGSIWAALGVGLFFALFAGFCILGGMGKIGAVTEKLVPVMSLVYIACTLVVIWVGRDGLGQALKEIVVGAFAPRAVLGAGAGIGIRAAMSHGLGRGIFSNEAGVGSSPIAHASAAASSAHEQGVRGIFEVFADTILMCTLTALAILVSGVEIPYGQAAGAELTSRAMAGVFGSFAEPVITGCILLFALSTVVSWSLYGCRCCEFLLGEKSVGVYKVCYVLCCALGAVMEMGAVWDLAMVLNGLMAIPNVAALIKLRGQAGSIALLAQIKEKKSGTG